MLEIKFSFKEWLKEIAQLNEGPWSWLKDLTQRLFSRVTPLNHALAAASPGSPISRSYQGMLSNWERYFNMGSNDETQFQAYSSLISFQERIAKDIQGQDPVIGQELLNWWDVIESVLNKQFGHKSTNRPVLAQPPVRQNRMASVIDKKNDSWFGRVFKRTA